MANPIPVPSNSVLDWSRSNTSKSLLAYFMSNPTPLSATENTDSPSPSRVLIAIRAVARGLVNLSAFEMRLTQTWRSIFRSHLANPRDPTSNSISRLLSDDRSSLPTSLTTESISTSDHERLDLPRRENDKMSSTRDPILATLSITTPNTRR